MQEMDDSRTSAVGRKRNLGDEEISSRHSSPEDDMQRASKRAKEDDEPLADSTVEDEIIINPLSSVAWPSLSTPTSQPLPAGAALPGAAWNRGVQSGLRTSFGGRAQYQPKPKSATPILQGNNEAVVDSELKPKPVTPISQDNNEAVVDDQPESKSVISNSQMHIKTVASAAEGCRLYISNLAYAATEEDLQSFFRGYLIESTSMPKNQLTGRPVGYAYVDLPTPSEAERAITELSSKEILDRKVSVQLSRKTELNGEKSEGAASGGEAGSGGEGSRRRKRSRRRGRSRGGHDADSLSEIGPAATIIPQMLTSNIEKQGEEDDMATAEMMKGAEHQNITTAEQEEAGENSSSQKLSLPQIETAFPSEAEEGEISSSRGSGNDMDDLSEHMSGPFGQYTGDETLFSNGAVDSADALYPQAPHFRGRDDGQPAGNALNSSLRPRDDLARASPSPSLSAHDANDTEVDANSLLHPTTTSTTPFKIITDEEVKRLSNAERSKYRRALKPVLKLQTLQSLTAEAEAVFAQEGSLPLPKKYRSVEDNISDGLTFFPRKVPEQLHIYRKNKMVLRLPEILTKGNPIRVQDFSFNIFAPAFLKNNQSQWTLVTPAILTAAFNFYVHNYYSHVIMHSKATADSATAADAMTVEEAQRQATAIVDNFETKGKSATVPDSHEKAPNDKPIPIDLAIIEEMERKLQRKYFPSATNYHCLACGDNCHITADCPSLTCILCGGGHAQFTCPQNRRCEKCRQRGHQSFDCPEKLALSKAEAIGCDFCGSTDHVEVACHSIWRTFFPREIRKVRDIPVHCYVCGGTGHYGPECGLYRGGPILSGGNTWSKANLLKFIDVISADRAMSAGIDDSIASQPTKDFSIKGKANNLIDLDDSNDDEPIFLRKKVKGPKAQHQIRIAKTFPRAPNPPRESRPEFGRNNSGGNLPPAVDSARYGRERTFSPPPRFDDMRYNFPEADDHFRRHAPQRQDSYQPRPPLAQDGYQPAPQGSLPVGTPSMGSSNASRGGHGGRGGRAQSSSGKGAQGGGTRGREKRRKRAGRGGGAPDRGKGK